MTPYNHKTVEKKWQGVWKKEGIYTPDIKKTSKKDKFYNLFMFPYPSAEGLHVGHAFSSIGSDIYGRFMRMNGKIIFQPMGYDSFGIHSENYAIKINENPNIVVKRTTKNYGNQLRSLGNGYDWTRTVTTSDPDYYRWTQWLFIEMYKQGLAYRKKAEVNFCPSCKTVLADEQVEDGRCERCDTAVVKKDLDQWFFKITDYADRLLEGLDKIDWSPRVLIAQKEWIGKSKGLNIDFKVENSKLKIIIWTKFWETIFGTTFLVLAPEHKLLDKLKIPNNYKKDVDNYIKSSLLKSPEDRKNTKEKSGIFTGLYALNPVNKEKVPIWIADYVLTDVGTGAVMGVPAHDVRDFDFAKKYKLPIIRVVAAEKDFYRSYLMGGENISDKDLSDLSIKIIERTKDGRKLEIPNTSISKYNKIIKEKMLDGFWNEYVGDKIIFIFKNKDGKIDEYLLGKDTERKITELASQFTEGFIKKEDLAWSWLSDVNIYKDLIIHETGGKIENSDQFNNMDVWGKGKQAIADWLVNKDFSTWLTTYHLRDWLVSRQRYWGAPIPMIFCSKCEWQIEENLPVLLPEINDYKPEGNGRGPLANHPEFFEVKCPKCGGEAKRETDVMDTFVDSSWYFLRYPSVDAKSSSNMPFDADISKKMLPVDLYFGGAEHSVLHLMYARFVNMVMYDRGYLDHNEPFPKFFAHGLMIKDGAKMSKSKGNVVNPDTYVEKFGADTLRMYVMFMGPMDGYPDFRDSGIEGMSRFIKKVWRLFESPITKNQSPNNELNFKLHKTIKKITEDIKLFKYNTSIAGIMELVNKIEEKGADDIVLRILVQLLAPFAPHMAEEIWREVLGQKTSIHITSWPKYDEKYLIQDTVTYAIQINGKLRSTITVEANLNKEEVITLAKTDPKVAQWLKGGKSKKEIFIPNKLINLCL